MGQAFSGTSHPSAPPKRGWDCCSFPVIPKGSMFCQICNFLKMWGSLLAWGAMFLLHCPGSLGSEHAALQIVVALHSPCSLLSQKMTPRQLTLGEGFIIETCCFKMLMISLSLSDFQKTAMLALPSPHLVFFCFCILCRLSGPKLNSLQVQVCEGTQTLKKIH